MVSKIVAPNYISEDSTIEGKLEFKAHTQVFGIINGTLRQNSTDSLEIGKPGWIIGDIFSLGPVYISGKVEGNVFSKSKIFLSSSAEVKGNLEAHRIEIVSGAIHNGQIRMIHSNMVSNTNINVNIKNIA